MTDGAAQPDNRPGTPSQPAPGAGLHAALSQAYIEMVRLYRAGDHAGAQAIRDMVQAELGGLIERAYRGAVAHAAAGRATEAFSDFVQAIELHRTNIANLALPVGLSA